MSSLASIPLVGFDDRLSPLVLDGSPLSLEAIASAASGARRVTLAPEAVTRVAASRAVIERILATGQSVYGVNTGFGKLADLRIPADKLAQLQTTSCAATLAALATPSASASPAPCFCCAPMSSPKD